MEETSKHGVLGRYQTCSKERSKVLSDAIERHDPLQHSPSLLYPEGYQDGNWRNHMRESICVTRPPPKISFTDNWMQELGSEVAGHGENSQQTQTQPKTTNPILRTGRPVSTEQPSSSSAQEIDKRFLLGCESTNERTGRPVENCVPVSVERLDKDKDADEHVDADQVRTGRPVGSEQSIDLFTQREEIDINFRVSGLPHAVVKQAENLRVRELVKKIESHPHRQALQADLQQSNACNPFSENQRR